MKPVYNKQQPTNRRLSYGFDDEINLIDNDDFLEVQGMVQSLLDVNGINNNKIYFSSEDEDEDSIESSEDEDEDSIEDYCDACMDVYYSYHVKHGSMRRFCTHCGKTSKYYNENEKMPPKCETCGLCNVPGLSKEDPTFIYCQCVVVNQK
jgi:hypothetical protein